MAWEVENICDIMNICQWFSACTMLTFDINNDLLV